MDKPLYVHADWDAEVGVWVATSTDVPGLATEADTVEALIAKLESMIPELLAANGAPAGIGTTFARRLEWSTAIPTRSSVSCETPAASSSATVVAITTSGAPLLLASILSWTARSSLATRPMPSCVKLACLSNSESGIG